jgi:hypothetical protein
MADICKCSDKNCPSKLDCYRYIAESDGWQSYFAESPRKENEKKCEYFWKLDNKKENEQCVSK